MEPLGWIAAAGAGLAAILYVFRQARVFFRMIDRAATLLTSELTNNSGTSMKDNVEAAADDLHGIAVAVGLLQRNVDGVTQAVAANAEALGDVAERIEVLEEERADRRRRDTASDEPATQEGEA